MGINRIHTQVLFAVITHLQEHLDVGESVACSTALTYIFVCDTVFMLTPLETLVLSELYGTSEDEIRWGLLLAALRYLRLPFTMYKAKPEGISHVNNSRTHLVY